MRDFDTILPPDEAVVMRAVWNCIGWSTIEEIMEHIWQDGFTENKVRRLLGELCYLDFVAVEKMNGNDYYAQRITQKEYYPNLHPDPKTFIEKESIRVRGMSAVYKFQEVKKNFEETAAKIASEKSNRTRRRSKSGVSSKKPGQNKEGTRNET